MEKWLTQKDIMKFNVSKSTAYRICKKIEKEGVYGRDYISIVGNKRYNIKAIID